MVSSPLFSPSLKAHAAEILRSAGEAFLETMIAEDSIKNAAHPNLESLATVWRCFLNEG